MEIIDSHTHWGPSSAMGIEVTTEELLRQAEQSGVSRIVIFPFPLTALAGKLEKVLSLPIKNGKKDGILSKNLRRLIGLG